MPQEASGLKETFGIRARDILNLGSDSFAALPAPAELRAMAPEEGRVILVRLRVELYAISAIIADEAVRRSMAHRAGYPPLGLLRSLFTDFGVISASPSPLLESSITDFRTLGKALIDTMVFHLDALLQDLKKSDRRWLLDRLGGLLALFRPESDPRALARLRDPFSFVYGGLQFGTSTCVQLVEVMTRLLDSTGTLSPQEKVRVMKRSIRPAYDLASVNVEDVPRTYGMLQPASAGPEAGSIHNPAGWMDPAKFKVRTSDGEPWKVVLAVDLDPVQTGLPDGGHKYPTQGCPARISPAGGRSPIGQLWEWSVELAEGTKLL